MIGYWKQDMRRTAEYTLKSVDAVRTADSPAAVKAMAVTSRCLFLIERDLERAVSLAEEADALARRHGLALSEVWWALGLAHHHLGDLDRARRELCEAVEGSRGGDDHWHHCMCLQQLACIALEQRRADEALSWCAQVDEFAAKLGEGSERPFGHALAALARVVDGSAGFAEVEHALVSLREIDAKSLLAYALNMAAELAIEKRGTANARHYAEQALDAAEAVDRSTERVVAQMILASLDLDASDTAAARTRYQRVLPQLADRFAVSQRARAHAAHIAARLGLPPY
jgi:hypothetical protein